MEKQPKLGFSLLDLLNFLAAGLLEGIIPRHTRVVVAGHGTNRPQLLGSKAFNHIFHLLSWICSQYCSHFTFNRQPHHYNCDQYHWEIIYHSLNACPPGPRRLSQRWESHYCWRTSSPPLTSTDPCFRARWHNYVISGVCLFLLQSQRSKLLYVVQIERMSVCLL